MHRAHFLGIQNICGKDLYYLITEVPALRTQGGCIRSVDEGRRGVHRLYRLAELQILLPVKAKLSACFPCLKCSLRISPNSTCIPMSYAICSASSESRPHISFSLRTKHMGSLFAAIPTFHTGVSVLRGIMLVSLAAVSLTQLSMILSIVPSFR